MRDYFKNLLLVFYVIHMLAFYYLTLLHCFYSELVILVIFQPRYFHIAKSSFELDKDNGSYLHLVKYQKQSPEAPSL